MSCNHKHDHCEHTNLKHCPKCDVVYCVDCGKEWTNWSNYTFTYPATTGDAWSSGTLIRTSKAI